MGHTSAVSDVSRSVLGVLRLFYAPMSRSTRSDVKDVNFVKIDDFLPKKFGGMNAMTRELF